ncbi:MAG: thermonuclease family protein [Acidobacteriota bacterium]
MAQVKKSLALILTLVLSAWTAQAWAYTALVEHVHDGDTVTVDATRVRLYGIDAPELAQAGGKASRDYLSSLVEGARVEVIPKDIDAYGRTVAVLRLPDGRDVNALMVAGGQAWVYKHYCHNCYALELSEAVARFKGLGLWSGKRPVPPWVWRKHNRRTR